ncbi:MAG: VWA domain-containing protein [Acidobacteriaceae bacterium]
MSIRSRIGFLLLIPVLCTPVFFAQHNTEPTSAPPSKIDLDVVVTPKSGPAVAGLEQKDFTIFDNKAGQHITSFQARNGSQDPVQIILVIDAVNTTYQTIAYERGQIDRFLRANGGRLAQPMTLAFFTDKGMELEQGFSTDGNGLSESFDHHDVGLRDIRRSSQYEANDRFQLSMTALGELIEQSAKLPGRKMIFWVSPGWPLLSGPRIELDNKEQNQIFSSVVGLSTELRQARIILYSVDPLGSNEGISRTFYYQEFLKGVSKQSQVNVGDLSLQVLAVQSGGLALASSNDVAQLLEKCMADTEAYYELSFVPAAADHRDEYHNILVQVAKPGLTARTRTGYYAQP